jgi:phosphotransferase system  glucose/maltose/N-acetylglucosamine-specific IIC component
MTSMELAIGFIFPVVLMIIGYWKEEVWLFYVASVGWLIIMAFLFNNYTTNDYLYWIAWLCLGLATVCATAQLWLNKGKPLPTQPEEETAETKRENRSKKLAGLRGLANKIKGKDF